MPNQRLTTAVKRRIEHMTRLIDELRQRPMTLDAVCFFLKFSSSGARKYIADLKQADMLRVVGTTSTRQAYYQQPEYQLTLDEERVTEFMTAMRNVHAKIADHAQFGPKEKAVPLYTGRMLHLMKDDEHFHVRRTNSIIPRPDPLLAMFYGQIKTKPESILGD